FRRFWTARPIAPRRRPDRRPGRSSFGSRWRWISCTKSRVESNPERTDSPTHIRPDLSAVPDPLHLAAAAAALDQDRGGGARVGRIAVSPVERTLVGLGLLSGVSTPGGRPLQLGAQCD